MKKKEGLKQLKDMSPESMKEKARTIAEELMRLRFRKTTGQLEQSHRLRELRRSLAQVKTLLSATKKPA